MNQPFHIDTFRKLLTTYDNEEISIGKLVEELNTTSRNFKSVSPSPAIGDLFVKVPVTTPPIEDGYYILIDDVEDDKVNLYFMEGEWYDNEHEARVNEHHESLDVESCYWLKPCTAVDLQARDSGIWEAAVNYAMAEEFGGVPNRYPNKHTYLQSL